MKTDRHTAKYHKCLGVMNLPSLILALILIFALQSCTPTPLPSVTATAEGTPSAQDTLSGILPPTPHIERTIVGQMFDAAGEYLQQENGSEIIAFTCSVFEGTFCWFGERVFKGGVSKELAKQVVDQIGGKAIEHAKNNEVKLRCVRELSSPNQVTCEIDWGWGQGWQGVPLK